MEVSFPVLVFWGCLLLFSSGRVKEGNKVKVFASMACRDIPQLESNLFVVGFFCLTVVKFVNKGLNLIIEVNSINVMRKLSLQDMDYS